jgi:hypothetical protein
MSTTFNEFQLSAIAYPNGRIAVLLAQYPHVNDTQRDELVRFIDEASPAELRNLRGLSPLRGKLDRLLAEQPADFRTAGRVSLWIGAAVALAGLALWLL